MFLEYKTNAAIIFFLKWNYTDDYLILYQASGSTCKSSTIFYHWLSFFSLYIEVNKSQLPHWNAKST